MKSRTTEGRHEQRPATGSDARPAPPSQQTFGSVDDAGLEKLRERLRALQYTEESVSKRLRIWHVSAVTLPQYPIYQERLAQRPDALSTIISLFLLQGEVPREALNGALRPDVVDDLLRLGVLTTAGAGAVVAAVSIYPCSGSYLMTDHQFRPAVRDYHPAPDQPVMHLGQDSYALAYLAPRPPKGGRVLDLCTGSGVHAIAAARRAKSVIGVDINPRAAEFARFNAALNGVTAKCDFRRGSLYDAVGPSAGESSEQRFDLVLANPPFVPSPRTGPERVLFQDAGPAGDEILGPVLAGLLKHLTPGGTAAVISMFADQKRSSYMTKIKSWLGSRTPVDLLFLRLYQVDPEELASVFTWRPFGDDFADYSRRYREWLGALRAMQIVRLTFGVLLVRLSQTSNFRTIDVPLSYALSRRKSGEVRRLVDELD